MSKLRTFLLVAATVISVGSVVLSATSAFAHDGGSSHEGFGHGSDHQGSDRNQSQNQIQNQSQTQNLQNKLINLNKTGNDHSIFQGLKQWHMKEERTRTLGEIVKLVQELNSRVKLGQLNQQQFQAILSQGAKLQAKFLANGGTEAELAAAHPKSGGDCRLVRLLGPCASEGSYPPEMRSPLGRVLSARPPLPAG